MQPIEKAWLRGVDLNHRPLGYEPNELPDCSTPQFHGSVAAGRGQMFSRISVGFFFRAFPEYVENGLERKQAD